MTTELIIHLFQITPWYSLVTAAVAVASAVSAATPTPKKGTKLARVYKFVDVLAINIGKAKDKG